MPWEATIADPTTTNILLAIPTRGSDVGTWDTPVNGDFTAIDGYFGGVQIISAASSPIILTSPSGAVTPSGGPTQAQNAVLRFTGTLTANVQVTLPLPGPIVIENLTTGNFVLTFAAVNSGQVIAVDQGEIQTIYNDGTNVRFVNLGGRIADTCIWAGLSAMPAWVAACTVPPYLLCDGSIYNFTTYPYLGKRLGAAFGGNGVTTFGVPDHRGRMSLPYDGTGTRITTGGCGLNGQTIGAALDMQSEQLTLAQIPTGITSSGSVVSPVSNFLTAPVTGFGLTSFSANAGSQVWQAFSQGASIITVSTITSNGSMTSNNTGGVGHPNVQPSQVTGISVIRAA